MNQKIVQLFSPGLDSFLAFHYLKQTHCTTPIRRVYFDLKCRYSQYEIDFLKNLYTSEEVEVISNVINLGKYEKEDAHVPNRNLLLVSLAQGIFDADVIYLNGVKDDRVSDNTESFRKTLSENLSVIAEKPIRVESSLGTLEKTEVVKKYVEENNNPLDLLRNTFSCYNKELFIEENLSYFEKNPNSTNPFDDYIEKGKVNIYGCLECTACYRKLCALTSANIYVPFFNFKISKKYNDEVIKTTPTIIINGGSPMNITLQNRRKSICDYHQFLSWMGCD